MRNLTLLVFGALAFGLSAPISAETETREEYLARLRAICEVECMQPRELLRKARKRRKSKAGDMSGILDIRFVSRYGEKYRLHTSPARQADFFDLQQFDFGMPEFRQTPVQSRNDIVVEIDEVTFRDLLALPLSAPVEAASTPSNEQDANEAADGIIVDGEREAKPDKPKLTDLRNLFEDRRIVVRGKPRLTPDWIGARRDMKNKQLTLELASADDLVLLPRYDDEGNPIPEKSLGL